MSEFQGKRVLITGAVTGVGEAIVEAFLKNGATVFAMDGDETLLQQLKTKYPQVTTTQVDFENWGATREAVDQVSPIHHLVNNASTGVTHELLNVDKDLIDRSFNINFKSIINVSQAVFNGLKGESGTIVNISSTLGAKPGLYTSLFCSSKAAVTMLTKCMALEFGPANIRVNCIRPSLHTSGLGGDPVILDALVENELAKQVIKGRIEASQVADLALYLSSSRTAAITGEDVVIDGGLLQLKTLESIDK